MDQKRKVIMDYSGTFVAFVSENPEEIRLVKKLLLSTRDTLDEMDDEGIPLKPHTFTIRLLGSFRERWGRED